jgi:mRNA interferase MazF
MAMITSASHAPWPLDVPIGDLKVAGLPAPSIVRFKLFTLDHRLVRGKLGRLAAKDRATVQKALRLLLESGGSGADSGSNRPSLPGLPNVVT